MRFDFDARKSAELRANPRRGIGFEQAQQIFDRPYWLEQRSDAPEQYHAIGWVNGRLYSVIFEIRDQSEGEVYHLVKRSGKRRRTRLHVMKKTRKPTKPVPAESIARIADRGKDVSRFFTNGRMVQPIQRVNLDLTVSLLAELDRAATELNISRQAVIKTLVRQGLDHQYIARNARQAPFRPPPERHTI